RAREKKPRFVGGAKWVVMQRGEGTTGPAPHSQIGGIGSMIRSFARTDNGCDPDFCGRKTTLIEIRQLASLRHSKMRQFKIGGRGVMRCPKFAGHDSCDSTLTCCARWRTGQSKAESGAFGVPVKFADLTLTPAPHLRLSIRFY